MHGALFTLPVYCRPPSTLWTIQIKCVLIDNGSSNPSVYTIMNEQIEKKNIIRV